VSDERAYVSRLWAEDWNSPEDSVYDEYEAPIDWPARFRRAAEVDGLHDEIVTALTFLAESAELPRFMPPYTVEAVGRALLGGTND
jgi:hypothetical protein